MRAGEAVVEDLDQAGPDGHSYFSEGEFDLEVIGDPTKPVYGTKPVASASYAVRVVPPGWERDWGPAAHPILAIYLSGEAEIEASNGDTRKLVPGLMLLAEDTSGPGHRVRVTSHEPVTVIQIHLSD